MSFGGPPPSQLPPNPFRANYETVYGVGLVDDLHNFFPEILYNPQRFDTVPQLLYYVQRQLNSRFNLYQHGRSQYFDQQFPEEMYFRSARTGGPAAAAPPPSVFNTTIPIWRSSAATSHAAPPVLPVRTEGIRQNEITLSPLLSLLRSANFPVHAAFTLREREDVVVRPTPAQIRNASLLTTGPPPSTGTPTAASETDASGNVIPPPLTPTQEVVCTICQDTIQQADECRQLTHCRHAFHQTCIDQWFQRNVRCPVCRHDIRNMASAATATGPL